MYEATSTCNQWLFITNNQWFHLIVGFNHFRLYEFLISITYISLFKNLNIQTDNLVCISGCRGKFINIKSYIQHALLTFHVTWNEMKNSEKSFQIKNVQMYNWKCPTFFILKFRLSSYFSINTKFNVIEFTRPLFYTYT